MRAVRDLLFKELKLSASPITWLFILFGAMFMIPGYPVLCGAFFVTLGIFYSFQAARESNDILYSALLPVAKRDVVKGKYVFVCLVEAFGSLLMAAAVLLRMTWLAGAEVYLTNPMMNGNLYALGWALIIFGSFNLVFVAGFFRTAYRYGRPFVIQPVTAFILIGVAETLHHIPGLEALNASAADEPGVQLAAFCAGLVCYAVMTLLSCRTACRRFERIDL